MAIDKTCLASALAGDLTAAADLIESLWSDAYRGVRWVAASIERAVLSHRSRCDDPHAV